MLFRFREMKIQNKLLCSAAVSIFAIAVVWFLISKIISASDDTFKNAEKALEVTNAVGNTSAALQLISEPVTGVLHNWNVLEAHKGFEVRFTHYQEELSHLKILLENEQDPNIRGHIKTTEENALKLKELSLRVFKLADKKVTADGEGKMFAAQAAMETATGHIVEMTHVSVAALNAMKNTETILIEKTKTLFALSLKNNKQFSLFSIVILLVGVLITTLVSFIIARSVSLPVKNLQEAVYAISQGNLDYKIATKSYGEIGDLTKGVTFMIEGLKLGEKHKSEMARISAMIENATGNFMFADNDLNITYMNPASKRTLTQIENLLPCSASQFIGKTIGDLTANSKGVREILSDEKKLPYLGTISLKDEIIGFTASAIYDHNNARIGTMANWALITEKHRIKTSLEETTSSLNSASSELEIASNEMRITAEETTRQAMTVATISEQTNQNVHSVASAAEEMSATVSEISRNMEEAHRISSNAVQKAHLMNEMIMKLDQSNQEINKVIKVINSIADQTNLLALNATIEAARAGEAGKGFAVVANEVKELAKGTSNATNEIREQIHAIQSNTKDAIQAIAEITGIINSNNEIASTIASAMVEQSTTTTMISQNMTEVAKGTEEVTRDIGDILSATRGTTSAADHIQESSKNLTSMASRLAGLIDDHRTSKT